jgi:hypothetical protein
MSTTVIKKCSTLIYTNLNLKLRDALAVKLHTLRYKLTVAVHFPTSSTDIFQFLSKVRLSDTGGIGENEPLGETNLLMI